MDNQMVDNQTEFKELFLYVKSLAKRIDILERENQELKNNKNYKNKKQDIINQLNTDFIKPKPSICFQQWIENLDYKSSLETVFREDLITGCIEVLERGINKISIIDHDELPLCVFSNKPNSFYIYDKDIDDEEKEEEEEKEKWTKILNVDLDKWFVYIGKRFLIEFKSWFDINEELIKNDENMSNKYVENLQKTLGGQRISEESRNNRLRQHIYKTIKQ